MSESGCRTNRLTAKYEARYSKFLLHSKNYVQQYNLIYLQRMQQMKPHLRERALHKWGGSVPILTQIIDIQNDIYKTQDCVLIGMIFKDLKLRGSILDEVKEGKVTGGISSTQVICSNKDNLILEDPSGRATLAGNIAAFTPMLVTGVVVAVKGRIDDLGEFVVNDWAFYFDVQDSDTEMINQSNDFPSIAPNSDDKYVMLVSGLNVGSAGDNEVHDLSIQLLGDFVGGRLGDQSLSHLAAHITRIVVAGNSIAQQDTTVVKDRFNNQKHKAALSTPSKQLDIWLAQILNNCHVDIMPGSTDPANIAMPQQPLHPCVFPHSARFNSFERITNPAEISLDGVVILGHSGQPVNDIARQSFPVVDETAVSSINPNAGDLSHTCASASVTDPVTEETEDNGGSMEMELEETVVFDPKPQKLKVDLRDGERRIQILKDTLAWGHLCPTIPDTTPCYPYAETDPFILSATDLPDVLFAGNQPTYSSRLVTVKGTESKLVRLVCVPSFRETGIVVLCNISQPNKSCFCVKLLI